MPPMDHAQVPRIDLAVEQFTGFYSERGFETLRANVKVRRRMFTMFDLDSEVIDLSNEGLGAHEVASLPNVISPGEEFL